MKYEFGLDDRPYSGGRGLLCGVFVVVLGLGGGAVTHPANGADVLVNEDYNQWKRALGTNQATAADSINIPPGFRVELVRSAQPGEGSWVALTFDPRGRLIVAREDRGLLRLTLPSDSTSPARVETINTNLLECRGLLYAHGALYANANNSKGLYRLRDTDNDDRFDEITLLKATPGGVGHGRNQLALGPDGWIYSIHGDDVGLPADGVAADSPLRHFAEDHLLPCEWDKTSFNASARMPYGHLVRTDADGRRWEIVAGGLRNPFGIAFNESGDLFTYDADMELDVGLSWYHPTRVLHLVPGGDYGWRRGSGVLPVWSPDTLPSAVDIGVGSPTAVQFGTGSRFPEPWRSALFILDWAYGRILAVHLKRSGASYTGRYEVFASGRPLNVTGLAFGPDGAMYFSTGGRRTQSGVYRVSWLVEARSAPRSPDPAAQRSRRYEEILAGLKTVSLDEVWKDLSASDRWAAYAARTALEARPIDRWHPRALRDSNPTTALSALLAVARTSGSNDPTRDSAGARRAEIVERLLQFPVESMSPEQRILALRTLAVCITRLGSPNAELARRCRAQWEPHYPDANFQVNQSLSEVLAYLDSAVVVSRTLPLLASAASQNEKFQYLLVLRAVKAGWTIENRRTYFNWLARAGTEFHGSTTLPAALKMIRHEATAGLAPEESSALSNTLAMLERPAPASISGNLPVAPARRFVRDWTLNDLQDLFPAARRGTNASLGARLFSEAGCMQCHRFGQAGGVMGPDLTAVGNRFDRRALLESLVEPSRVVAEVYRTVVVITKGGEIFEGRLLADGGSSLTLGVNPLDPASQPKVIANVDVESRRISDVSPMPSGLINSLEKNEILELVTWLEGK